MAEEEMSTDMAAILANLVAVLDVERVKVQASGQKPTEISDDLKSAVLRLISH
jgi:hypothetical protein